MSSSLTPNTCVYLTKNEERCKRKALATNDYCSQHDILLTKIHSLEQHSEDFLYKFPTEIIHNLFLGSEAKVCDTKWLRKYNIKTVVNATDDLMCTYGKSIKFYMWNLEDRPTENIIPYLEKTAKIIDKSLSNNEGILVHCHMGISRSASLVWYYLATRKYKGDLTASLKFLESKRWIVNPNSGFKKQIFREIKKYKSIKIKN